jgi:cysteine desulfurase
MARIDARSELPEEWPSVSPMIYLDHNATTPLLDTAREAWLEAAAKFPGNPSSPHRAGSRADHALDDARERLASILDCSPQDIVWTSGATESNNMVLHHAARTLDAQATVWISAIEHPCVLESARHYFGARTKWIPARADGVVNFAWMRQALKKERPGLVAVMAANNETGVLQPWREILALCRKREISFFCDAAQWIGKLPGAGLGQCDFVSGSAHKFGGPKGVGFLKCPGMGPVQPLLLGGPQEERRRAGTENLPGVAAMLAALEAREKALRNNAQKRLGARRDAFECWLVKALPGSTIVGAKSPRLWNTMSVLMPKADCQQRWVVKLDKAGVAVSTGSACSSGKESPSHVLTAMGCPAADTGRVIRISAGWETTGSEWDGLRAALLKVQREME